MNRVRTAFRRVGRRWSKAERRSRRVAGEHVRYLETVAKVARDGKLTYGTDGWLFLADDLNDAFGQHTGRRRFDDADLERWIELLERRQELLRDRACEYVLMVAPETHSVYPEKLPPGTPHATERPVHQLIGALGDAGSTVPFVYPLAEMVAGKDRLLVSSKVDSHWTDFGAFIAYSRLMDELEGRVRLRRLHAAEVTFSEVITAGDLGNKLVPARLDMQPAVLVRYPHARPLYDNCIENTGSVIVLECPAGPPTTCLLLGDSYSYPLVKYLSESFGRLVFAHSATFDLAVLDDVQPDIVVSLMAERFLIEVPDDDGAALSVYEQWKRENHRTRPPLAYWPDYPWLSPFDVERLRSHLLEEGTLADVAILSVLAYAGLLPRELMQLTWSDVEDGELRVRKHGPGPSIGARPERRVPLMAPVADDLREWRRACGDEEATGPVFPGRDSRHWAPGEWATWAREVFRPAVEACGLEIKRPHDLRHTYCTLRLHEGTSSRLLAKQIGCKPAEIRGLYGYLVEHVKVWDPIDAGDFVRFVRLHAASQSDRTAAEPIK